LSALEHWSCRNSLPNSLFQSWLYFTR